MKLTGRELNMLQDVITEFGSNPDAKRSFTPNGCKYNPPKRKPLSRGCAIGMYLPVEVCKKLDGTGSIDMVLHTVTKRKLLPEWMLEMDDRFLGTIQNLHDIPGYWTETGLSSSGIQYVKDICKQYKLDFKQLKFPECTK